MAPPSRDQPEKPVWALGHRDPVWYRHLTPDRAPAGARSHSWDRAACLTPSPPGGLSVNHLLARFLRRVYLEGWWPPYKEALLHLSPLGSITAEPNWVSTREARSYSNVAYQSVLAGLWKADPKQKSQNKIQAIQQKPCEDPSEFLEKIYQAYRHYTNTDPEAPDNIRTVNLTFFDWC